MEKLCKDLNDKLRQMIEEHEEDMRVAAQRAANDAANAVTGEGSAGESQHDSRHLHCPLTTRKSWLTLRRSSNSRKSSRDKATTTTQKTGQSMSRSQSSGQPGRANSELHRGDT
jgi:hypothetical protein